MSRHGEARGSLLDLAQQIWELLEPPHRSECLYVVSISIVAACFTVIGVAGIAPFFAVLADPSIVDRSATLAWMMRSLGIQTSQGILVSLGMAFVALLSLANLANFLSILAIGRFSQGVGAWMHSLLFDEYLHRELGFHGGSHGAELAVRIVHEVNRTVGGVIQGTLMLCAGAATTVLMTAAVVVVDPLVAAAAAAALIVSYALFYSPVRRRLDRNGTITTEHWRMRARVIAESFAAIKDVMLHRAEATMTSQVARHSAEIAAAQASSPAVASAPKYVLECITAAGLVAAALWIYRRAGAGQWVTQLAFLGFAAYRLLPALQQVFTALARIHAERAAFEGIADDLHLARRRHRPKPPAARDAEWCGRPRRAIRLVGVSYRYSAERSGGVSDVSLEIPAGTLSGLVGPNGSGKSTLAELILGLREPDAGRVEIDGIALDDGNRYAWLDTVAYVPQQIALLDDTIARNIAFGVAPHELDLARVRDAAARAQLWPVIEALPDGIETIIGESGARLSGGHRQRLGLARALYRRASLLVVDEATNALDGLTENEIIALLRALRGTCTVIVIAHRLSSLAACDALFELDSGRLVGRKTLADFAPASKPRGLAHR
jgi:ATP-binding cassette, subfamily B, bacterial PglK